MQMSCNSAAMRSSWIARPRPVPAQRSDCARQHLEHDARRLELNLDHVPKRSPRASATAAQEIGGRQSLGRRRVAVPGAHSAPLPQPTRMPAVGGSMHLAWCTVLRCTAARAPDRNDFAAQRRARHRKRIERTHLAIDLSARLATSRSTASRFSILFA